MKNTPFTYFSVKSLLPIPLTVIMLLLQACSATLEHSSSGKATENKQHRNVKVEKSRAILERQYGKSDEFAPQAADIQKKLTLQQIMANPDWIGLAPKHVTWSFDSSAVLYQQVPYDQSIFELHRYDVSAKQTQTVAMDNYHLNLQQNKVMSSDGAYAAWVFSKNVFIASAETGDVQQVTFDTNVPTALQFINATQLTFQQGARLFIVDAREQQVKQLAQWHFGQPKKASKPPKDYLAEQQQQLIKYIGKQKEKQQQRFKYYQQLRKNNSVAAQPEFYLPQGHRLVTLRVSPSGLHALAVTEPNTSWRGEGDIMPNYIDADGRITSEKVRRKIADAKPVDQSFFMVQLKSGKVQKLSFSQLPGYNDDVLAKVKQENAEREGNTYTANRLPRAIGLVQDWYWSQSAIQWHSNAQRVAIMLEAWDNKDRWLVTAQPNSPKVELQHRLQDPAWIAYKFNEFGWFSDSEILYLLSEESGYSHLYTKPVSGKLTPLTRGKYEVRTLHKTNNDKRIYFTANKSHPGIYEVYSVDVQTGEIVQHTELNGITEFQLSPNEKHLLLTHSKMGTPPELFLASASAVERDVPEQITYTVSKKFQQNVQISPEIVTIPSSHGDQPIFARLFLPSDFNQSRPEQYKAVIFTHGAGYLQNAHYGWSSYFRETLFNVFLSQQGYVVLDVDYRASAGYGRDWRTSIYRRMGEPEVEDLVDSVDWLSQHWNVDRKRVGTYGGSYGGFLTFMAMFKQPDLFKAGAALRPVTDWAHYNTAYTSNILNTPNVDPIAYERSSPIYFAEGLKNALLINAPMVDSNVHFHDVVRLVQRLIELEKENFETAIYPVEPHGFVQPSSWLDEYRRIFKLFENELSPKD